MRTETDYIKMQKDFYEAETPRMSEVNHRHHDANPDYWNILLGPLSEGDWTNKKVLDFGCGCGRNVMNMLGRFNVKEAHGCDISRSNIEYCKTLLTSQNYKNFKFFVTNGNDLGSAEDNHYDYIMSTIVLQHICVYSVRRKILESMYKALAPNGIVSIQMGYGVDHPNAEEYYVDAVHATSTNSGHDVKVTNASQLIKDFEEIGFENIETSIRPSFSDGHNQWIFVKATKS
jgi:ubiquinone/menaquinone biosynthesis C-methylase UbiE